MFLVSTILKWSSNPYVLVGVIVMAVLLILVVGTTPPNAPPIVKEGLPIIGPTLAFMRNPFALALRSYRRYGDVFTLKVLHQRLTFLVGPEASVHFLTGKDEDVNQEIPYRFSVEIFGRGVVYDVEPSVRLEQIRLMSGALRGDKLKSYVPLMVMEAEQFFEENWGASGTVDLREAMSQLIILTAARCLMGKEIRENLFEEVAHLYHQLDQGLLPITFFFPNLPIPAHRARNAAREQMIELFSGIIAERRAHPEVEHNDVLDVFMKANLRSGPLTVAQISGLMVALLFAGQHTSSITASWTGLQLLNAGGDYLKNVVEEQDALMDEFGEELSHEVLENMPHLQASIMEALRINPPLPFVMRKCMRPFKVRDIVIPKGDMLFVSPPVSHRDESIYPNSESYEPDRFLPPRNEHLAQKFGYLGFGGGRHACLGENFAYVQIKTIWSVLFRKYKMQLVDPYPEPDWTALVVGNLPCRISYELRQ